MAKLITKSQILKFIKSAGFGRPVVDISSGCFTFHTARRGEPADSAVEPPDAVEGIKVGLEDPPDLGTLEKLWLDLQARSDHSFFQSWCWIGCWLKFLPPDIRPALLVARFGQELVGLAIVTECVTTRRWGLIRSRTLFLNQTGRKELEVLTVDHNGILACREIAGPVRDACLKFFTDGLRNGYWDEVVLPQVPLSYASVAEGLTTRIQTLDLTCHYIDLDVIRAVGDTHLKSLSKKARRQIGRTTRKYQELGPITVKEAESLCEAQEIFDEMLVLHQSTWTERGVTSSFIGPCSLKFHRLLMKTCFDSGVIQLVRVSTGSKPLACSYYFRYQGRIYCYQWGVDYAESQKFHLGLMIESLLIDHNIAQGAKVFDFLFGTNSHKRRLANGSAERVRLVMQGDRLQFKLENCAHALWRAVRRLPRGRIALGDACLEDLEASSYEERAAF